MNLTRWRGLALRLIAVLVATASLAAFAQSYRGLYDWAREHGLSGFWAGAWPVQLDVFIAVGELALFVALVDRWPRRARIGAWTVTLIGAAVSVAGNVGHVAGHDIASRLTAAVPPVAAASALFVALTILKWVTAEPAKLVARAIPLPAETPPLAVTECEPVSPVAAGDRQPDPELERLADLTRQEQAKALNLTLRTLYRRLERGELPELAMANSNGKH